MLNVQQQQYDLEMQAGLARSLSDTGESEVLCLVFIGLFYRHCDSGDLTLGHSAKASCFLSKGVMAKELVQESYSTVFI
jgi:hypothetical protein